MHLILFLDSIGDYACLRTVSHIFIHTRIELRKNVSRP